MAQPVFLGNILQIFKFLNKQRVNKTYSRREK